MQLDGRFCALFHQFTVVDLELADVCDTDKYKQPIMHAGTKLHAKNKEKILETLVRSCHFIPILHRCRVHQ